MSLKIKPLDVWYEDNPFSKNKRTICHFDGQEFINWLNFDRMQILELKNNCQRILSEVNEFLPDEFEHTHISDTVEIAESLNKTFDKLISYIGELKSYSMEKKYNMVTTIDTVKDILAGKRDGYDNEDIKWSN